MSVLEASVSQNDDFRLSIYPNAQPCQCAQINVNINVNITFYSINVNKSSRAHGAKTGRRKVLCFLPAARSGGRSRSHLVTQSVVVVSQSTNSKLATWRLCVPKVLKAKMLIT